MVRFLSYGALFFCRFRGAHFVFRQFAGLIFFLGFLAEVWNMRKG